MAEQITLDKQNHLADLSILSARQKNKILGDWNNTSVAAGQETTVTARFESIAARTPDATALVAADQKLSYAELNARANRLANLLMQRGVGPGERVVLCLPRSVDLVVAIEGMIAAVREAQKSAYGTRAVDYASVEATVGAQAAAVERAAHAGILKALEVDAPKLVIGGETYSRIDHALGTYRTMAGEV